MKNRKRTIVAFLICACLVMGIGYAAFSDVMDITGTAELNVDDTYDGHLIFESAIPLGTDTKNTASVNANNPDKASFTVNDLVTDGETCQFKFVIKNTNTKQFKISLRGKTLNADAQNYYSIDTDLGDSGKTIAAYDGATPGTLDVIVTVEMTSTPTSGTTTSASFLLELLVEEIVVTP